MSAPMSALVSCFRASRRDASFTRGSLPGVLVAAFTVSAKHHFDEALCFDAFKAAFAVDRPLEELEVALLEVIGWRADVSRTAVAIYTFELRALVACSHA